MHAGVDDSVAGRTRGPRTSGRSHAGNRGLGRHHSYERGASLPADPRRRTTDRHSHPRREPLEGSADVEEPPDYVHSDAAVE